MGGIEYSVFYHSSYIVQGYKRALQVMACINRIILEFDAGFLPGQLILLTLGQVLGSAGTCGRGCRGGGCGSGVVVGGCGGGCGTSLGSAVFGPP